MFSSVSVCRVWFCCLSPQIWPTSLSRSCPSCWLTQTLSTLWMETQLPCTFTDQRSTSRKSKVQFNFKNLWGVDPRYLMVLMIYTAGENSLSYNNDRKIPLQEFWLCLMTLSPFFLLHRVHPEICNRGGSEGAGGGGWWLFIWKLHVWFLRRRGPGHGVVVKGGLPHPAPSF